MKNKNKKEILTPKAEQKEMLKADQMLTPEAAEKLTLKAEESFKEIMSKISKSTYRTLLEHVRVTLRDIFDNEEWSYRALARAIEIHPCTLSKFLTSKTTMLNYRTYFKIERFLDSHSKFSEIEELDYDG